MNNYQLYRTNPKLGGQVAWNIILDGAGGELKVRDFNLSPYSPYASFAYNEDRDWLRYTHQENLSHLYSLTKGTFYDPCIDSRLMGCYPLLDEIDPKNKAEDFGTMRIPYKRYGKQFSVLCPVWLEDFGVGDTLRFEFILRPTLVSKSKYEYGFRTNSKGEEVVIAQSSFTVKSQSGAHDNQAKFESYFFDYVDYISSKNENDRKVIGDDIINITIENSNNDPREYGSVTGLHVPSGNVVTKDITDFLPNLYERERPVMETDSLIQSNIYNNELIVKQLFNFNFAFNLTDISSAAMASLISTGGRINVDVKVYVNNSLLERKVFDSNYIFISKNTETNTENMSQITDRDVPGNILLNDKIDSKSNVYGYLLDARCLELIKHNKLSQYIHHWSLTDNNDYIFNLYRGFAAKTVPEHFYKSAPNYWETDVYQYPNTLNWCKNERTSFESFKSYIIAKTADLTQIPGDSTFVELTRFNPYTIDGVDSASYNIGVKTFIVDVHATDYNGAAKYLLDALVGIYGNADKIGLYYTDRGSTTQADKFVSGLSDLTSTITNNSYTNFIFMFESFKPNSLILAVAKNSNPDIYDSSFTLTYKYMATKVIPVLQQVCGDERFYTLGIKPQLNNLVNFFNNVIEPSFIYLHNSLNYQRIDSHSIDSKEIEYTKDNNTKGVVIRYVGNIKPTFVNLNNVLEFQLRYYDKLTEKCKASFEEGIQQGYLPYYPSTDYWYLEPTSYVKRNDFAISQLIEDKWYDFSVVCNVKDVIYLDIESKLDSNNNYYKLEELISEKIGELYPYIGSSGVLYDYFMSLYDISSDFEYVMDENGKPIFHDSNKEKFKYTYRVKLTLK